MLMQKWVEGTVIENKRWTQTLFSLRVDAELADFEAGQFAKLALPVGDEMVARPYSFVNAPEERPYEFYYAVLPGGPLTQPLSRLASGNAIHVAPRPSGFLVLSEVPDAQTLWLISSGTGLGPFLSMLKTDTPWRRFERVILVHAVRHSEELTYRDQIVPLLEQRGVRMRCISFVSRQEDARALSGRIPAAIQDGRLESAAGATLSTETSQVMLCGNPGMVADTVEILKARGMRKNRRREPGHITMEAYW